MTTTSKNTIQVTLLGQKIPVKSSEQDDELLAQISQIVSIKIKNAEKRAKNMAPHHVTLLALLDLAADYVHAKRNALDFKHSLTQKLDQLQTVLSHREKPQKIHS